MSEFSRYDRYPADILADTRHLTLAEKGAYNDLLDTMWLQDGWLPNNAPHLGRIVQASERNWRRMWPRLKGFFLVSEDGKWITQKRLMKELQKARSRAKQGKDTGQNGRAEPAEMANLGQNGRIDPDSGQNGPERPKGPERPAKMPTSEGAKSLVHARARAPLPKKEVNNFFISISTPAWRAWQQLKPTPTIFSAEHHANGWWFPSEWPPGTEHRTVED